MSNNTDIIETVTQKVVDTIEKRGLLENSATVVAALSGGADSVCLLHVLNRVKNEKNFKLLAAHLNHMIRGAEADDDQKFCERLCADMGVELITESADIPALSKSLGISEEEAGRRARYDFFTRVLKERKADAVATAHNMNDQAETVLMRVVRGTGLSGLRGIRYKRDDGIIRPLLDVSRAEIEEYCAAAGLEFRTDSTNGDTRYTRNSVRLGLIPYIEKEFNPNITAALVNLADTAGEDADFMEGYAERLYARLRVPLPNIRYKGLHIETLRTISQKSIITRLIILCAKDAMGEDYSLEKKHIGLVFDIIDGRGSAAELLKGLRVSERYGWLEFLRPEEAEKVSRTLHSCNNIEFCVEVGTDKLYNIEKTGAEISLTVIDKNALAANKGDILLDADKLGITDGADPRFTLRSRIAGDRIAVYKNGKTKKLKSLFIDRKIRRENRERIPVLCYGGEIIAVPGVRVSEIYKPDKHTKNYLVVRYEGHDN